MQSRLIRIMQHRSVNGEPLSVAIIGAGIVGCSIALGLAKEGYRVTIFDREEPGSSTSYGNAGAIVTGSVTPTATPAVIRSMPSYVFDRQSPAVLRLRHAFSALPWLMRFIGAGTQGSVDRIAAAMHPLVSRALEAHKEYAAIAGVENMLTTEGWLKIYSSASDFESSALERRLMARHGVVHEILECEAILDLQPGLNPSLCFKGLYQPNAGNVRSPKGLAAAYLDAARRLGAQFVRENIISIASRSNAGVALQDKRFSYNFDRLVVAAGAWSTILTKQLNDNVSLESERGYHISFGPGSERLLNGPVVLPGKGFVLSPMHDGLRLISGDELAGLKASPDYRRIEALLPAAMEILPALRDWNPVSHWMGHRPSTPDTLPVIGKANSDPNIIYAFGHGHLGVTLSAVTAKIVTDLVSGCSSDIDLAPYSPMRF